MYFNVIKTIIFLFPDPVVISGEGEYNLNVLKESVVTDSFLNLDKKERGCQNEETYANCTTRLYIDAMINKCGCLPLAMSLNDMVR